MKRKLVKQGQSALTMTLPSEWVKQNGLNPGDLIDITTEGDVLILNLDEQKSVKKIEISINKIKNLDWDVVLPLVIGPLYRSGFDEILVNIDGKIEMAKLNRLLGKYDGLEIMKFTPCRFTLIAIASCNVNEFSFFLNKMIISSIAMGEELVNVYSGDDFDYYSFLEMYKNNRKTKEFALRAIVKADPFSFLSCNTYTFVNLLERISEGLWNIGKYINLKKIERNDEIKNMVEENNNFLRKLLYVNEMQNYRVAVEKILGDGYYVYDNWIKKDVVNRMVKEGCDFVVLSLLLEIRRSVCYAGEQCLVTMFDVVECKME